MAGITLAQAEAKLQTWLDAEDAVARGQEYAIEGRSLKRADLKMIGDRVTYWNGMVAQLSRTSQTSSRVRRAVPYNP